MDVLWGGFRPAGRVPLPAAAKEPKRRWERRQGKREKFLAGEIFSALLCRLSPDPHYGRAGGLALISARKICERSHRLLLRKMEKILRGISNAARLDGGKDCQQLLLTRLAHWGRPRVLRISRSLLQNGRLAVPAGAPRDC